MEHQEELEKRFADWPEGVRRAPGGPQEGTAGEDTDDTKVGDQDHYLY